MATFFRHYDSLRLFTVVARYSSFSDAADALAMTKGAVSYQIKTLEEALDIKLFRRQPRGVVLTEVGQELLTLARPAFQNIETGLAEMVRMEDNSLTVGMSSYFASRWLSPRLMTFMQDHPGIQLRLQPMTRLFDLDRQGVDLAIRWGNGEWDDVHISPLMPMPAWPVGNRETFEKVQKLGLRRAISDLTLLRDHDDSNAWSDWLAAADLHREDRKDTLIIPDPNVRVQAVIDGQGIALMDALVQQDLDEGRLFRLSEIELSTYGYFLARPGNGEHTRNVDDFVEWLKSL
ncbi:MULTISPECIES: LysR substrate-binding domain-containing protein [unclassified Roseovarius]|uniref:LysR substrate-binding domain-containing protein n=1 Tax=unclassified Roseovarius TaxID=2614913 RepID=UPI00273DDF27|nr:MULTISPECIES: LysR substrate-binding domain-containing protein [unclassified Roseovarius]